MSHVHLHEANENRKDCRSAAPTTGSLSLIPRTAGVRIGIFIRCKVCKAAGPYVQKPLDAAFSWNNRAEFKAH